MNPKSFLEKYLTFIIINRLQALVIEKYNIFTEKKKHIAKLLISTIFGGVFADCLQIEHCVFSSSFYFEYIMFCQEHCVFYIECDVNLRACSILKFFGRAIVNRRNSKGKNFYHLKSFRKTVIHVINIYFVIGLVFQNKVCKIFMKLKYE